MPAQPLVTIIGRPVRRVTKYVRNPGIVPMPRRLPELNRYYDAMLTAYGRQDWWPGRTRFEVIVGAILTQNTSWKNVRRAIACLRQARLLSPQAMEAEPYPRLTRLIRSSGYFRQKARTLKAFVRFLRTEYAGSLTKMFRAATSHLREQLLAVRGIGPETADAILLYAGKHPVFVVDAYTRRILQRHALIGPRAGYEEIRTLFERSVPRETALYNEFHALLVRTGKQFCHKKEPRCAECPLKTYLPNPAVTKR